MSNPNDTLNVEMNEAVAEEYLRALAHMLASNPDTRKRLQNIIRREIKLARKNTSKDVRSSIGKNDPRQAYRAVKSTVYRRILGGNISILSSRRAGTRYELLRERKIDANPRQWGGNRRAVGDRTYRLSTYWGKDRGFILRFLNSGTKERVISFVSNSAREHVHRGSKGGDISKYGRTINTGRRGSIAQQGTFEHASVRYMDNAASIIAGAFENEFAAIYNEEIGNGRS